MKLHFASLPSAPAPWPIVAATLESEDVSNVVDFAQAMHIRCVQRLARMKAKVKR